MYMKKPAQHLIRSMKISERMIAIGILKRSKGQFCINDVIAVADVPRAADNLALTVEEEGMQIVLATG